MLQDTLLGRAGKGISRRDLIQVGGLGLFGLNLPRLLYARNQAASDGIDGGREKSCIFIVLSGGPSHIDTLDPKPQAPAEIRGPYRPISTPLPGVQLTEMLPRLAGLADRYTLVRSLSHTVVPHVQAAHMLLTGQSDGSRNDNTPFMGSLVAKFRPTAANLPPYIWLHNMKTGTNKIPRYESGLDVIGHEYAPMRIGHELDNPADNPDFRVKAFDPPPGLSRAEISERFRLLRRLEGHGRFRSGGSTESFHKFQEQAHDLVTGPATRRAFNLDRESETLRDRYGRHPLGQYLLMSRRLIEAGVRLVTVTGWPGLAPGEKKPTVTQVWDTHDDRYKPGDNMFGNGPFGMKWSLPRLDQGVSALLEDLDERGLLEDTLVVLAGEFGRTPRFEGNGRGRGHWPNCYSALLAGGGVRRGFVYGSSDAEGAYVASGRPVSPDDFGATLFHALGIPPETRYGPDGFSLRVSDGRPLHEIFG